jgi:hypothetical protein
VCIEFINVDDARDRRMGRDGMGQSGMDGCVALKTLRPCLAGLQLRLHERLRSEPCQTVSNAAAPDVEPVLELLAASKGDEQSGKGGSARLRQTLYCLALGLAAVCAEEVHPTASSSPGEVDGGGFASHFRPWSPLPESSSDTTNQPLVSWTAIRIP